MLDNMIETTNLHYSRARDNQIEISTMNLDLSIYDDKEKIKTIDAFILRFIKLQDYMGDKLFRETLKSVGEYKDNMSLLDILDKLEKLEIIKNADHWLEFRINRNKLTHEYPDNQQQIIDGIKLALEQFEEISEIFNSVKSYLKQESLLLENNL